MKRFCLILSVALLAGVLSCEPAQAGGFGGFGCGGYGYGYPWLGYGNYGAAAYALGNVPTPPYFALHPPVYYSHSIAYPFGRSPFAYPCNCHPEAQRNVARVYVNPFIEEKPAEVPAKAENKVAAVSLRIVNPYYKDAGVAKK